MEIDEDNTLKLEYHNNLFIDDVMHNYTDYHLNTYDNKIYYGDPTEKFVVHKGTGKYWLNKIHRLRCNYCYEKFSTHTDLIRHLGYNNVDIRNRENNLLITHFYQPIKNKYNFSPELKYSSQIAKENESDDEGILADTEENYNENNKKNTNDIKEYVNKKKYRQLDDLFLESFSNISLSKCKICNKKNSLRSISNYSKTDMKSKLFRPINNTKNNKSNKNNKNKKINLSIDELSKYLENSKI